MTSSNATIPATASMHCGFVTVLIAAETGLMNSTAVSDTIKPTVILKKY